MNERRLAATAAAVPALWVPLTLLHPFTLDDLIEGGRSGTWLAVHGVQLVLTPLLALVVLRMLAGLRGMEAAVARVVTVLWVALFGAFDAIAGIATGILARGGHDDAARALFDHAIVGGDVTVLSVVAHPLWGAVAISAAMALRAAGHGRTTILALWLSVPFALTHVGPVATAAVVSLTVAVWTGLTDPVRRPTPAAAGG